MTQDEKKRWYEKDGPYRIAYEQNDEWAVTGPEDSKLPRRFDRQLAQGVCYWMNEAYAHGAADLSSLRKELEESRVAFNDLDRVVFARTSELAKAESDLSALREQFGKYSQSAEARVRHQEMRADDAEEKNAALRKENEAKDARIEELEAVLRLAAPFVFATSKVHARSNKECPCHTCGIAEKVAAKLASKEGA